MGKTHRQGGQKSNTTNKQTRKTDKAIAGMRNIRTKSKRVSKRVV